MHDMLTTTTYRKEMDILLVSSCALHQRSGLILKNKEAALLPATASMDYGTLTSHSFCKIIVSRNKKD